MDKDKIQNIAEELADSMYGKDFYDLSGRQQSEIYSKAIRELNDMLADKADMMRKNEADGGIIRAGFANGTMMASVDNPFYRDSEGDRDEHSMRLFGKPYKELNAGELEEFQEEMMRLMNKFMAKGGRVEYAEGTKMASYGYDDAMAESFAEFLRLKKIKEIPEDMEFDEYLDQLDIDIPYSKKNKNTPRMMAQTIGS